MNGVRLDWVGMMQSTPKADSGFRKDAKTSGMRPLLIALLAAFSSISLQATPPSGAVSEEQLATLYKRYFAAKDVEKLKTLVYWSGVQQSDRESFARSLEFDLKYQLKDVRLVPLQRGEKLEYSRNGVTFRPSLTPVGRLIARYEDAGTTRNLSTSYLVGTKDGRYFIALASPAP